MKKGQGLRQALVYLIWEGQLGLNLIMPLLLCLGGCWWLTTHMGVGLWIYLVGFFLGLGSGFTNAWQFYKVTIRDRGEDPPAAFNRHR